VAGTGGSLEFPDGTYRVTSNNVMIRSNLTLQLGNAVIQVIPNAKSDYNVLTLVDASNVNIIGGTLQGDFGNPVTHLGSLSEGGVGLYISGAGSQNIVVAGTVARDCMGDGFYIGGPVGVAGPSHVTYCSVQAIHNRRSGLTITHGGNLVIRDSSFTGSGGTLPECGLNIEPNQNQHVDQVLITGCTFTGNAGDGVADGVPLAYAGTDTTVTNVTITGNTVTANGGSSLQLPVYPQRGIEISNCSGHVISDNIVSDNYAYGILWRDGATGLTITGNTVTGNHWAGLSGTLSGNTVSGNTVSGNGPD
jgi:parallel beta-helix repeat protein